MPDLTHAARDPRTPAEASLGVALHEVLEEALDQPTDLVTATDPLAALLREAVVVAGWRPPVKVIDKPEDLDARPIGTVVRTDRGRIAEKTTDGLPSPCGRFRSGWMLTQADEIECGTDELDDLPATVIWFPPCRRCGAEHDNADELCADCERIVRDGFVER